MLAAPSICPPERKKASTRPWPAQSKSSRPPSVKKLWRALESSETNGWPLPRCRASSAAVAGMGDCAPTATCRRPAMRRRITAASSSSSRQAPSGRGAGIDIAVEIAAEALLRRGETGIFGAMRLVARIFPGERQGPGAARGGGNSLDIERGEDARRARLGREKVAVMDALDRDHGFRRGMRHGRELAPPSDPDIAVAIGHRRVEEGDVGADRRQQDDRIAGGERVVDDAPIGPPRHEVGTDEAAQRHEGNAFFRRLQRRMDGGAGRVLDADFARGDRGGKARRRPELARLTAEVSIVATAPAPISRSAWSDDAGSVTRWRSRSPRRMRARVASMATPPYSGGTTSIAPSPMPASASSRLRKIALMASSPRQAGRSKSREDVPRQDRRGMSAAPRVERPLPAGGRWRGEDRGEGLAPPTPNRTIVTSQFFLDRRRSLT